MRTVHHDGAHSRGRSAPDACSVEWDAATTESLYGTAAPARFWICVEQNGPWGRTAATQSYLPADVGDELTRACRAAGGRLGLIRRPGEHADPRTGPRLCYLAWSGPQAFLLVGRVETPEDLLRLPFDALASGDLDAREVSAAPAVVPRPEHPERQVAEVGRLEHLTDGAHVEPAEGASPGQQHPRGREAVTAGMRAFPDPPGVTLVPGQGHRPAADGAADVVATVGADEEDRLAAAELRQGGHHGLAVTHGQSR